MNIDLFPFQQQDVDQLKVKKSRLCANDPGTGKTYVGIALDQLNRQGDGHPKVPTVANAKTLVVAPKSVVDVWDQHLMELTDDYIYVLDGDLQPAKAREQFLKDLLDRRKGGYFVCHWESLRLLEKEINKKGIVFFHIIADEVHRAKNPKAQQTRALKKLKTWYKTGLSGTPADNKPHDLWSILNWLWPHYYTSFHQFVRAYILQETTDEGYKKFVGVNPDTIGHLRAEMKPWYTRRRKEDVLTDLPDKYYSRVWVTLTPQQRRAYDEMRKTMTAWVDEHKEEIEAQSPIIASAVVAQLIRLSQFAVGYVVPKRDENGEHIYKWKWPKLHSDFMREAGVKTREDYNAYKLKHKDDPESGGAVKVYQYEMIDPSSKLDVLMDIIADRMNYNKDTGEWEGEQIVVFSQFRQAINLLEKRLVQKGIPHGILTGGVSQADRAKAVQDFQAGHLRVFAGTIKAGGVGLTLTAASTVIFIDRDWSPSINGQAEDRLHRIGQKEAVEVIDLMARNTVDLGKKQQLSLKARHLQMLLGDTIDPELVIKNLEQESLKGFELKGVLDYTGGDDDEE